MQYSVIKKSIVAIVINLLNAEFPPIIGTGFFIKENGFILTNRHIVEKIAEIGTRLGRGRIEDIVKVFYFVERDKAISIVPLSVTRAAKVGWEKVPENYYGEDSPDIGFLELKDVKDCPVLNLFEGTIKEGEDVCLAGFPMGTDTLKAPGWIHQIGPTLQRGIIGAVLPFPCESPHAILLDIMTQGGSSGSPVFLPDSGQVIGILYGGLNDFYRDKNVRYRVPTSLSLAIPYNVIKNALATLKQDKKAIPETDKIPLVQWIKEQSVHQVKPKDGLGMLRFS